MHIRDAAVQLPIGQFRCSDRGGDNAPKILAWNRTGGGKRIAVSFFKKQVILATFVNFLETLAPFYPSPQELRIPVLLNGIGKRTMPRDDVNMSVIDATPRRSA